MLRMYMQEPSSLHTEPIEDERDTCMTENAFESTTHGSFNATSKILCIYWSTIIVP